MVIFNGGYSDLSIQFNSIVISTLFLFLLKEKNYFTHLKKIFITNKIAIYLFIIFLIFLIFQTLPIPIEIIKFLSPEKYKILNSMIFENNFTSISLDPSNTFFNFLNYFSLFLYLMIFKCIFYKPSHIKNFYYFMTLLGAISAAVGVYSLLKGNPDFFFIDNSSYKNSATGFFINRTVFSCFLVLCLFCGIEYVKSSNQYKNKSLDNFFKIFYIRVFILLITIGIVTTFSRLGNFLFISMMIIYIMQLIYSNNPTNKLFLYTLITIILFDILILGYYFGSEKLLTRFSYLSDEITNFSQMPTQDSLSRYNLIYFAIREFKNFIFFGYGAGAFEYLFKINYQNLTNLYTIHAHSDLVEFIGEFGLIGFLLLNTSIFFIFFKNDILNFKNSLLIYLLFFILIFDFSFRVPVINFLFIILFSINSKKDNIIDSDQ